MLRMLTQTEIKTRVFRFIGKDSDKGYRTAERLYRAGIKAEIRSYAPFGNRYKARDLYTLHREVVEYTAKLLPPLNT